MAQDLCCKGDEADPTKERASLGIISLQDMLMDLTPGLSDSIQPAAGLSQNAGTGKTN